MGTRPRLAHLLYWKWRRRKNNTLLLTDPLLTRPGSTPRPRAWRPSGRSPPLRLPVNAAGGTSPARPRTRT
jgi:hypothetical protein